MPIEESLLFIQPIYLVGDLIELPEFKSVVVVFGEETRPIMRSTLNEALAVVFGTSTIVEEPDSGTTTDDPSDTPTGATGDVQELVVQIDTLLQEAAVALTDGDLGLYQSKVNDAALLTERLRALLEEASG